MAKKPLRALLFLGLLVAPLCAQADEPRASTLTVRGEAVTKIAPDQVTLPVTIRAENTTLAQAKDRHDERLRALLQLAAQTGIAKDKTETSYTSISPEYDYSKDNNKPHLRGYQVQTTINLTLTDIAKLGSFTNNVINLGIDTIGNVNYSLQNEDKVREDTLMKAMEHARTKAERLASTAGVALDKPYMIEEGNVDFRQPPIRPMRMAMASNESAPAPELPSGLIEVRQSVTVTYQLK